MGLHCSARASHRSGFYCCGARALGMRASVVVAQGLSSCGSRALECRLSSCGTQASLLHGMWDIPGIGLEPISPALAGRFLTTAQPGKSPKSFSLKQNPKSHFRKLENTEKQKETKITDIPLPRTNYPMQLTMSTHTHTTYIHPSLHENMLFIVFGIVLFINVL